MSKLSIIVPVYNMERYIEKCLESLVKQTLQDLEIIVVNDGSQDKSEEIIEKYVKQYPTKIKYYEKENGGLSSARNYGLENATGEYVAFLDSDDYVEKNMYEEMYKTAKKENSDMVECDFIWEWRYGKKVFDKRRKYQKKEKQIKIDKLRGSQTNEDLILERQNEYMKRKMMKKPRVVAWNKIYKREILNKTKIRFPEGLIYEDMEFFYKLLPYLNNISYIDKYFVHYIQRDDSISNSQTEKTGDIFKILDNIFNFYKEKDLYSKYQKELKYMKKRIMLGSSLRRILKIKNKHIKRKMLLKTAIYLFKYSGKDNFKCEKIKSCGEKRKICFGITKLGIGGAERVLVDVVNEISSEYDITIFSIYGGGELERELSSKIKLVSLFRQEKRNKLIPIYVLICGKLIYNKFLKRNYDVDIAFLEGPVTRIFAYKGNSKKLAWVHNDISKVYGKNKKAQIKLYIDKWFYKKYDKIVFVSEQNKKAFENVYKKICERKVIYNYINKERVLRLSEEKKEEKLIKDIAKKDNNYEKNFVVVSRLVKQKAIDRLIRVHKKLMDQGLNHKIYVIGDGKEKRKLIMMSKELSVEDSFVFLGSKNNPYPYIKEADFFALFSYYEGYGMVLEEAKILNKPILITNTASVEATNNYDKKLVIDNNEEAIFEALKKILLGEIDFLEPEYSNYNYDNKYLIEQIKGLL